MGDIPPLRAPLGISDLPDELLLDVFRYAGAAFVRDVAPFTCAHWRQLAQDEGLKRSLYRDDVDSLLTLHASGAVTLEDFARAVTLRADGFAQLATSSVEPGTRLQLGHVTSARVSDDGNTILLEGVLDIAQQGDAMDAARVPYRCRVRASIPTQLPASM